MTTYQPNYRIYDNTVGVTHDIQCESLEDAIQCGREFLEAITEDRDAANLPPTLQGEVGEIIYRADGYEDVEATRNAQKHDCSVEVASIT